MRLVIFLGVKFNIASDVVLKCNRVVKQNEIAESNTKENIFEATDIAEYIVIVLNLSLMTVKTTW